ncbi:MAG: hypothetical protein ACREWG_12970 [Gammaproteobacteria bacterium]
MSPSVRFEDEADAEYREAGRWYEARRTGLGLEFIDAVGATLNQIVHDPRCRYHWKTRSGKSSVKPPAVDAGQANVGAIDRGNR